MNRIHRKRKKVHKNIQKTCSNSSNIEHKNKVCTKLYKLLLHPHVVYNKWLITNCGVYYCPITRDQQNSMNTMAA